MHLSSQIYVLPTLLSLNLPSTWSRQQHTGLQQGRRVRNQHQLYTHSDTYIIQKQSANIYESSHGKSLGNKINVLVEVDWCRIVFLQCTHKLLGSVDKILEPTRANISFHSLTNLSLYLPTYLTTYPDC